MHTLAHARTQLLISEQKLWRTVGDYVFLCVFSISVADVILQRVTFALLVTP